ncbi:MAG TPA: hypothetical protein VFO54_05610 [Chryseosolibacter sp.]|nr:hypothetical protein [Chryseosolibacter sp.]
MKKLILITVLGFTVSTFLCAQEYKVSKSTGRLEIREVNHVSVEGYNGNEIIFTSGNRDRERDERAKGLRALSSLGLEDNTGLGLSVVEKGNVIEVQQLKKTEGPEIKIMVPRGVVVSYTHSSPYGNEIDIKNFEGEIEVSTVHNGVRLTNTTGPMSVKTVHGNIDASLGTALKGGVTLESVHGHVDVALPVGTKANLTLTTNWGEVLVDPEFKIELERSGELINYSDKVRGKLNGGGTEIALTAHHDNVYLRKK